MCQSLCPPEQPWHRAGAFPTGRAPPFGSPCRHFVDARGGRRLLRALPRAEPGAVLPSRLPAVPRAPGPGPRGRQGPQVLPRPAGAIEARAVARKPSGLAGPCRTWGYGRTRPGVVAAPRGWGKRLPPAGQLAGTVLPGASWKTAPSRQLRNEAAAPACGSPAVPRAAGAGGVPRGWVLAPNRRRSRSKPGCRRLPRGWRSGGRGCEEPGAGGEEPWGGRSGRPPPCGYSVTWRH